MDLQFFGANCLVMSYKGVRLVIDDNLKELGGKAVGKAEDVSLFTARHDSASTTRLTFSGPGEYEVSDVSVIGIPARSHMNPEKTLDSTMFKLVAGDISVLITGHVYPELSSNQLEAIGVVDVLCIPVGGSGYTLDPIGAQKLIKDIEPKIIVPTHYADKALAYEVPQIELASALKELGMEPSETVAKLKLKQGELSEGTRLIVLEKA